MTEASVDASHPALQLKGGMVTLTTLHLRESDVDRVTHQLEQKIRQAPHLLRHAPLILDVSRLSPPLSAASLVELFQLLRSKNLIPIGIRGGSSSLKDAALSLGLAIFPEEKAHPSSTLSPSEEPGSPTRVVTHPVRSGQQIYVPGGDLIILSSVSHGAEVLADGHIHIHGALRGRALAGVRGSRNALIYCKSLEAELVSIAGQYQISEDLKETAWKQASCIRLEGERLRITGM